MEVPTELLPTFSEKEIAHYKNNVNAYFSCPEEEYKWACSQWKKCSKCGEDKKLIEFGGNTSGRDAFDKSGYRLRRPECITCTKKASQGKQEAMVLAKKEGIPYNAPEGTICAICSKPPTKNNGLVFDHCHTKNKFRGYCCNSCNRSIGVLGDDIEGLLKALNYLLKSDPRTIQQTKDGMLEIISS